MTDGRGRELTSPRGVSVPLFLYVERSARAFFFLRAMGSALLSIDHSHLQVARLAMPRRIIV